MKNKCPGSGRKPDYVDRDYPDCGECPSCPSSRRLRKDGRLPAHQPSPNYPRVSVGHVILHNAAVAEIAKMFIR
jgi:hypothetical protein